MSKVYLITGTSSGFGRALAEAVLERGDRAILTARKPERVADLVEQYGDNALAVRLDVTNPQEREAAIKKALEQFQRIDVLVNNAGRGTLGAAEEFSSEQIRELMEVNFFGAIEMTRLVLPIMRRQKSGHILDISSIGGRVNIGGFALYGASKFALEGFSEALHHEVKPLGIHVTLIEPGAFRTEFSQDSHLKPDNAIAEYQPVIEPIRQYLYGNSSALSGDPHKAVLAMIQVVESDNPPLRLMLGADAYGIWEEKRQAMDQEIAQWRKVGENTSFAGVDVASVV